MVDWDGDGDLDLLSGSSEGGVQWAENPPGPGSRLDWSPFDPLIEHGPRLEYGQILRDEELKGPLSCTRIWVDDFNSDGKLDLLVGDCALVSPAEGLTEAEFKKKFAEWNKSIGEAVSQLNSAVNDEKKREKAQQHYQEIYKRAANS